MYKVFIDNKPLIFQINSQVSNALDIDELWNEIASYLKSERTVMEIDIQGEADFWQVFKGHNFIEAAGGLVQRDARFLFIKRNELWDIPKGKLDPGETPEIAAVREIEEECGIENLTITGKLPNTYHIYRQENKLILKQTHWFELTSNYDGELVPQTAEGITKVAWLTQTQIKKQVVPNTYASIKELIMGFITNQ